ncbi:hypothetical protein J8J14_23835, partial [Roseomonas sp. SSH11]
DHPAAALAASAPSRLTSSPDEPEPPLVQHLTCPKAFDDGQEFEALEDSNLTRHCGRSGYGFNNRAFAQRETDRSKRLFLWVNFQFILHNVYYAIDGSRRKAQAPPLKAVTVAP